MDERSFLEQLARSLAAFLAGERSWEELGAAVLSGWDAHRIGPRADEIVADLEAVLVWRSEGVLDEDAVRAALQETLERIRAWLDRGAALSSTQVEA
jgi:hypothetical protein